MTSIVLAGQSLLSEPWAGTEDGPLRELTAGADAAITNLEAAIADAAGWPTKTRTLHPADPGVVKLLKALGFNLLAHANNHAFDLGPPGILAAQRAARAAGIGIAGSGTTLEEAAAPIVTAGRIALIACDLGPQPDIVYAGGGTAPRPGINPLRVDTQLAVPRADFERLRTIARESGYSQRIASRVRAGHRAAPPGAALDFLGLTVVENAVTAEERFMARAEDLARVERGIAGARQAARRVVISLHYHHWEPDWMQTPDWLRTLAHQLADAGADVVFCHGPPVMLGMELHRGRPIFFGMGNLIFQTRRAARYAEGGFDVWRSIVARCEFDDRGLARVIVHPITAGRPAMDGKGPTPPSAPGAVEAGETIKMFLARSQLSEAKVTYSGGTVIVEP